MIDMSAQDIQRAVNAMEYILAHGQIRTIERTLKDCDITFREYRLLSELMMPAIRQQNEASIYKHSSTYYKGLCKRLGADDRYRGDNET